MLDLCCLLWARDGRADDLHRYEDDVLPLLTDVGGSVVSRVWATSPDGPTEVQVLRLPDRAALNAYLADPDRSAREAERDAAIERTELYPVDVVVGV